MEFDSAKNEYVLSTSRRFYAYGGVLGLGYYRSLIELHDGWDGDVYGVRAEWGIHAADDQSQIDCSFSSEEKHEIADYMIELWTRWKNS